MTRKQWLRLWDEARAFVMIAIIMGCFYLFAFAALHHLHLTP